MSLETLIERLESELPNDGDFGPFVSGVGTGLRRAIAIVREYSADSGDRRAENGTGAQESEAGSSDIRNANTALAALYDPSCQSCWV